MKLLLLQYLIPLASVVAIAVAFTKWQRRELSRRLFALWTLVWVGLAVVVQLPQKTDILARILGVGRGVDVLLFLSVIALFFIQFRYYVRLEKMERDITKIVRAVALKNNGSDDQSVVVRQAHHDREVSS